MTVDVGDYVGVRFRYRCIDHWVYTILFFKWGYCSTYGVNYHIYGDTFR